MSVLADDTIAVLRQMYQQIEHLWLQRDLTVAAKQLPAPGIERMAVKYEFHAAIRTASGLKK